MNNFIFDVDGTLTASRQPMDPYFKEWFKDFCVNNSVYLVTGSDYGKTQEQLGDDLLRFVVKSYNCSGNETWELGKLTNRREWSPPDDLIELINGWLQASGFSSRTGKHIEYRTGMINFSVVGRNATLGERKLYAEYDRENRERESIAYQINSEFDDITATVGGETGIDIHPTGWDKSQILEDFDDITSIVFFGDKTEMGGNDYPLAKHLRKNAHQVEDWRDTWNKLKEF